MSDTEPNRPQFNLDAFFPYQVRAFHMAVSGSLASVYGDLLGIAVNEWRTMAVLGAEHSLSASEIVERANLDKVVVSRAIKGLHKAGFLRRDIDGKDKRRAVLSLTPAGHQAFAKVLPLVQQREKDLLINLSAREKQTLLDLMEKVQQNAVSLATHDPK